MTTTSTFGGPGRVLPEGWSVRRISLSDLVLPCVGDDAAGVDGPAEALGPETVDAAGWVPPAHPVVAAVSAARTVLEEAAGAPVWSLSPAEAGALVVQLHALATQVAATQLRVLAHADTVQVGAATGAVSTAAFVAVQTRLTRPGVARQVRLAHAVESRWTRVADGLATATVNVEQAHEIVRALDALPTDLDPAVKTEAEEVLIGYAADHDAHGLRVLGRRVLDVVAPDVAEAHEAAQVAAEEARAAARMRFTMSDDGHGTARGRFTIPTAFADMLRTHLLALAAPARHTHRDDDPDAGPDDQDAPVDQAERTARDRARLTPAKLGEAFCDYISRYPADHTPDAGGVAATVVVTLDYDTLLGQPDQAGVATLNTGTVITAGLARRWACEAGIIPVVLGGASEVLDLGRTRRLHSKAQRIALAVRDGGCTAEDCDWPPGMCHAHHDQPWSHGGATDIDHARLLCPRHHARIHDPAYTTIRHHPDQPGGTVAFHRRI